MHTAVRGWSPSCDGEHQSGFDTPLNDCSERLAVCPPLAGSERTTQGTEVTDRAPAEAREAAGGYVGGPLHTGHWGPP